VVEKRGSIIPGIHHTAVENDHSSENKTHPIIKTCIVFLVFQYFLELQHLQVYSTAAAAVHRRDYNINMLLQNAAMARNCIYCRRKYIIHCVYDIYK
jgi:hypothetical protein